MVVRVHSKPEFIFLKSKRHIEIFTRQIGGSWLLQTISAGEIPLSSIDCFLELDAVYENVEFSEDTSSRAP